MKRISDSIREELARLLIREVSDPRLEGISITDVKVDRELAYAEIYVSALEGQERSEEVLKALRHAGGFLRTLLAQRIDLRAFPRLRFHWDPTPERAEHIERILAELRAQTPVDESAGKGDVEHDDLSADYDEGSEDEGGEEETERGD
jgi:ribosome-binding factor A